MHRRLACLAAAAALTVTACGGDDSKPADTCALGTATSLAAPGSLDLFGTPSYFSNGDALPAGRYRVTYVEGCMKYSSTQGWTIHAYDQTGPANWWLIGATTAPADRLRLPPGTVGYSTTNGAFATFPECVAANQALPAEEFDFAGGKLGVWLNDSNYGDNLTGEGGKNPTWKLERLGACN
jgi:hypothetical protein